MERKAGLVIVGAALCGGPHQAPKAFAGLAVLTGIFYGRRPKFMPETDP
jgi:hypothetical protein